MESCTRPATEYEAGVKLPATAHPASLGCVCADASQSLLQLVYTKERVLGYSSSYGYRNIVRRISATTVSRGSNTRVT